MCGVGSERHDQRLIWLQRRRSDATKPGEWQGLVASADVQLAGWRGGTGWIPLCDGLRAPATHPWDRPLLDAVGRLEEGGDLSDVGGHQQEGDRDALGGCSQEATPSRIVERFVGTVFREAMHPVGVKNLIRRP